MTTEDHVTELEAGVKQARRTSSFHKDNHLAAEAEIERLRARVEVLEAALNALGCPSCGSLDVECDHCALRWTLGEEDAPKFRWRGHYLINERDETVDMVVFDQTEGLWVRKGREYASEGEAKRAAFSDATADAEEDDA